jgi:hypothetical protein
MPVQINCPSCRGPLRVPEELFGQRVQCPTCQMIFIAEVDDTPTVRVAPSRPPTPRPRLRYDEHAPPDRRPHRGGTVLTLGILSLVFHCVPLGIIAWVIGHNDLKTIGRGEMDRAGEGTTRAGMICGMISSVLLLIWVAGTMVTFVLRMMHHAFFW